MNPIASSARGRIRAAIFFRMENCVAIGCLPITDDGIKEVYWLAVLARTAGQTHLPIETFPARLTDYELNQLASEGRAEPPVWEFRGESKTGIRLLREISPAADCPY
jgi:hypothetical protein